MRWPKFADGVLLAMIGVLALTAGYATASRDARGDSNPGAEKLTPTHATAARVANREVSRRPPTALAPREPAYAVRLKLIAELNGMLTAKFPLPPLYSEYLSDIAIKVLDLSPDQVNGFRNQIAETKARIAQLRADHATIQPSADGGFRITIEPYPKAGGKVMDDFIQKIDAIVGSERLQYYRPVMGAHGPFEQGTDFDMFGLMSTTIDVYPSGAPASNRPPAGSFNFDQKTGTGTATSRMSLDDLKRLQPLLYERLIRQQSPVNR